MLAMVLTAALTTGDASPSCDAPARVLKSAPLLFPGTLGGVGPRQSDVMIKLTIDANGKVSKADVLESSGFQDFDTAAMKSAMQTAYAPGVHACAPATGTYLYRAVFTNPQGTDAIVPPPAFAIPDAWHPTAAPLVLNDTRVVFADWSHDAQRVAVIAIPEKGPPKGDMGDMTQLLADLQLIGVRETDSFDSKNIRICDTFQRATSATVDVGGSTAQTITAVIAHGRGARYEVLYWRPKGVETDDAIEGAIYHFCVPGQM